MPYNSIAATERFSFFLKKGLYTGYRDADKIKEVSIVSSGQSISQAYELIQEALQKL